MHLSLVSAILAILLVASSALSQCDTWAAGPPLEFPSVDGDVLAATTWDPDGPGPLGPQLVVAGTFRTAGGVTVNNIARWDGTAWQPFGGGLTSPSHTPPAVKALFVLPTSFGSLQNQLVAAGEFVTPTGIQSLARWDGSSWQSLGTLPTGIDLQDVTTLALIPPGAPFPGSLLILASAGYGRPAVLHWDGFSPEAFPTTGLIQNLNADQLLAAAFPDPDGAGPLPPQMVVGGYFGGLSGSSHFNIAYFDPATNRWHPIGAGLSDSQGNGVTALALIPPGNGPTSGQLVAGGAFDSFNFNGLHFIARWDGSAWQQMGDLSFPVSSFTAWDSDGSGPLPTQLVASTSNGSGVGGVRRFDGSAWQNVGNLYGDCHTLAVLAPNGQGTQVVAGGRGLNANPTYCGSVATFSPSTPTWQPFTGHGSGQVFALTPYGAGIAGAGSFSSIPGSSPHNVELWDGQDSQPLGSGLNAPVRALKSFSTGFALSRLDHLTAGGDFTASGATAAAHIADWAESPFVATQPVWSPLGPGVNNTVRAIERFNSLTIAGGDFTATGNNSATLNHIAQWNGTAWSQLGTGLNGQVYALRVYNGNLYAGGLFTTANGNVNTGGLARWSGSAWTSVVGAFGGTVVALEVYNGELIIGGAFGGIPGTASPNIAKYNSVTNLYTNLGSGGADGSIFALAVDNGSLFVAGSFAHAGGVAAANIAQWNGSAWSAARGGTDSAVFALASLHDEIHAGGAFSTVHAGSLISPAWARYEETGAPWLAQQPLNTDGTCNGYPYLSVAVAEGFSSISFAWRKNGSPITSGPTGNGSFYQAYSETLSIVNAVAADSGTYDCIVSNSCGSTTSSAANLTVYGCCGSADFNCDGDLGTDADIEAFFACLAGTCPLPPCPNSADFNGDGDIGTDADIESFFRVLAGGPC